MGQVAPIGNSGAVERDKGRATVAAYAHAAGFSGQALITALAICAAESSWNQNAVHVNTNGTSDWGLWQINDVHKPSESVKRNGAANARAAYAVYSQAGHSFKPWTTYNNGAYKTHIPEATAAVNYLRSLGPAFEKQAVKDAGNYTLSADPTPNKSLIDTVKDTLNPAGKIAAYAGALFGNFSAFVLALVLLILGAVILLRKPIGTVAGNLPAAKPVKAARTVASAPRVAKTVEQRAADSVAFSEAKRALIADRAKEAAKEAPKSVPAADDFVARFKANQEAYRKSVGVDTVTGKR